MDFGPSQANELAQYRFLIALDDAIRPLIDPEEITSTAATILGRHLKVNRCAYAYVEGDMDTFHLTGDFNDGVPSIVGRYKSSDFGSEFLRLSREGVPYIVEDSERDPRVGDVVESYRLTQIRAVVSVPVIKGGKFVAGMAVHQASPRCWRDDEVKLVSLVANRCWESIERNRISIALREEHRRKDEFLAMLAHELRNPLSPISAAAQLIPYVENDPQRLLEVSRIIARQVDHITKIVDDLLDVSRVTRGLVAIEKTRVDLREIIREAVDQVTSLIDARGHRLTLQIPPGPARVQGDKTRLVQVVANLLSNAAKYTPQKGDIRLRVDVLSAEVKLSVRDNGIGISAELLPRVFDLFVQGERSPDRSQGGLGLGLALVRKLIDLHGGTLSAHSEGIGKGSEFTIGLPRLIESAGSQPLEPSRGPGNKLSNALTIMIVDDNADAAHALSMLLEVHGHRTWVEFNAADALQRIAEHAPQILILDIGLPDMDGYELARRIQSIPEAGDSVLIALTGYGQRNDKEKSRLAGFHHHMVKPVDAKRLLDILAKIKPK
jgi:signal transduction histidine kinase